MNTIGEKVKKYRLSLNLTQGELAEGICSRSYICQVEKGNALPVPDILVKIAERLQVSVVEICSDFDVSAYEQIQVHKAIRGIVNSVEEGDFDNTHKLLCKVSGIELQEAEKSVYEWGKGIIAQSDQSFYQAASYFLESINYARQTSNPLLLLRPLVSLGELYSTQELPHKAISYLDEAYQLTLQHDIAGIPKVALHYTIGFMHVRLGEYYSGIEKFEQAVKINQAYDILYKSGEIYTGIAVCYRHLEQYDMAEQYNFKALEAFKLYNDSKRKARIAGVYNNLGIVYRCTQKYSLSVSNLERAIQFHEEMGSLHWMNNSKIELSKVYNLIGKYVDAKELCLTAIENNTSEHTLAEGLLTLSETHFYLGEKDQALQSIDRALSYFSDRPNSRFFLKASRLFNKIVFEFGKQPEVESIYDKYFAIRV
ncbi:tetratricopeptide repeat protein [Brevibacillus laterosporus]|uniref:tetratricopeptide repeat protein n=1 Tax=Brevibacillus laterosporus TaxID=1465 RepID=UPI003D1BF032